MSQHLNVYMEELWAGRKRVLLNSDRVLSVSKEAASLHLFPLSLPACLPACYTQPEDSFPISGISLKFSSYFICGIIILHYLVTLI